MRSKGVSRQPYTSKIAIITGASSGLGRAYVRKLDGEREIGQFWLVARRRERLEALAAELKTPVRLFPLDLTRPESLKSLAAALAAEKPTVSVLINTAGFGKFGRAEDLSAAETDSMIALNCSSLAQLTRIVIPYLSRGSRVLEIASCAGFLPLPGLNLYAATKAFVLRYTRALRWELAPKGVRVTAVCPYWLKTEFMSVARDTANPQAVRHTPLAVHPETVADWSLAMNRAGLAVVTGGPIPFAMRWAGKLLPSCVTMGAWEGIRRL